MAAPCAQSWTPTRKAGLASLKSFLPRVPEYAFQRNFDRPGHSEVSRLSPYLRRRLISEEETITSVLAQHSFSSAEKFLQEVAWRTYWKGYLAAHPQQWAAFRAAAAKLEQESASAPWRATYEAAISGTTSLQCFNDWVSELATTAYLHNHARMWFASVWIFTLQLPWELGALFMYRHLLDGDPASNTLSWRWVGGLHTKGKLYLARADNIAKYSDGRWTPKDSELAGSAEPLVETSIPNLEHHGAHTPLPTTQDTRGAALLVPADDLSIELALESLPGVSAIGMLSPRLELGESALVRSFAEGACRDAHARMQTAAAGVLVSHVTSADELLALLASTGAARAVLVKPSVGPDQHWESLLLAVSAEAGIDAYEWRRPWDEKLFPLARKGFFPFWEGAKKSLF